MKKSLISTLLIAALATATCSDKKPDENISVPEGMNALDLSKYGKPFFIFVPDTIKGQLEITEESTGALHIVVGKNFGISVNEQESDINLKKQDLKEDEVNKLKQIITDESNAIVWESEIVKPEYHFLVNSKIGNVVYSFEDIREPEKGSYGKDAIIRMFESSKSIKEKPRS